MPYAYYLDDMELTGVHREVERNTQVEAVKQELSVIKQQYEELKSMVCSLGLDYKQFSKSKRMNNSTSKDMINDSSSSTRYRRRKETEKALTFIHGGEVEDTLILIILYSTSMIAHFIYSKHNAIIILQCENTTEKPS